jgi:hypothetical protein
VVASAHPKQGQDWQCEILSAAVFDLGLGFGKRAAVAETYRQDADVKRIWRLFQNPCFVQPLRSQKPPRVKVAS